MQLTISFQDSDTVLTVDVAPDMATGDLKAYIEAESGIPPERQILVHSSKPIDQEGSLESRGIADGDMIVLIDSNNMQRPQDAPQSAGTGTSSNGDPMEQQLHADIERVRLQMKNDAVLRDGVKQQYPQLVEVLDDSEEFRKRMIAVERERIEAERSRRQELKRLQEDPYNEESQKRILELIREEAVMENLNSALEHNPEVFGRVTMLFVPVWVNGHQVKAFVDSGAQATIMSPQCVERCNMSHLIDKRFQGIARGVGEAKIIGRIHSAPMKVGDSFLPCSFTVMENKGIEMLLGLDMLKRHQGTIDLNRNVLVMGGSEVPFLPESEIPEEFEEFQTAAGPEAASSSSSSRPPQAGPATTSNASTSRIADAQPAPTTTQYSDDTISNLMSLGFSRQQVVSALDQAGGNPELAAALLFQ
uniref:DNA damage-inducible protein 1 n=1 Tax=Blastobotrys adeninivorans TaxID=409370 RepID=A0A060T043_BLAAD